jgi:hypothetical protein
MRKTHFRKKPAVEQRIGMSIEAYIRVAGERGLSQRDMALELDVNQITMGRWIRDAGLVKTACYKREEAA